MDYCGAQVVIITSVKTEEMFYRLSALPQAEVAEFVAEKIRNHQPPYSEQEKDFWYSFCLDGVNEHRKCRLARHKTS